MKKNVLYLSIVMLLTCLSTNAQKIRKKEVDKFTKQETIYTSSESLYKRYFMGIPQKSLDFYLKKSGETYIMFATITNNECDKYDENSGITLLLENDDVVKLFTSYTGLSTIPKYSSRNDEWAFETAFKISKDDVLKLTGNAISDVRISTIDSYYDIELKPKKRDLLKKMLLLLNE